MTKIYFTYRHRKDRKGNNYTPSYEWGDSYPEWNGKATIVDEKVSSLNGKKLGWIEVDETALPISDVVAEVENYGKYGGLIYITNDQALQYMQYLTDYTEISARSFELSPAITEAGFESPQVLLTIS